SAVVDEGPIELQDADIDEVQVDLVGNGAATVSDAEIIWEDEAPQASEPTTRPASPEPPRRRTRRPARPEPVTATQPADAARQVAIDDDERPVARRNSRPLLIFGI